MCIKCEDHTRMIRDLLEEALHYCKMFEGRNPYAGRITEICVKLDVTYENGAVNSWYPDKTNLGSCDCDDENCVLDKILKS